MSPALEESALSEANEKNDGKITKLIRVIKYWNHLEKTPLSSYQIERLVLSVFKKLEIQSWEKSIRTFYQRSCGLISNHEHLPDRVDPNISIFRNLTDQQFDEIHDALAKAATNSIRGKWAKLFENGSLFY